MTRPEQGEPNELRAEIGCFLASTFSSSKQAFHCSSRTKPCHSSFPSQPPRLPICCPRSIESVIGFDRPANELPEKVFVWYGVAGAVAVAVDVCVGSRQRCRSA